MLVVALASVVLPSVMTPQTLGASSTGFFQSPSRVLRIASPSWDNLLEQGGTGLYPELLRKIYTPAGWDVEVNIVPWKRAKQMLVSGSADAMPAAYLTPAEDGWIYPNLPMDVDRVLAVFHKRDVGPWRGAESLKGRKVIWPRGYNFQNYLDVNVSWREVDSPEQGWLMVANQRADYYLDIKAAVDAFREGHPRICQALSIEQVFTINTYLRFADRPRSRQLIEIYERGMDALMGTPELRELFSRWGQPYPDFNPVAASPR